MTSTYVFNGLIEGIEVVILECAVNIRELALCFLAQPWTIGLSVSIISLCLHLTIGLGLRINELCHIFEYVCSSPDFLLNDTELNFIIELYIFNLQTQKVHLII